MFFFFLFFEAEGLGELNKWKVLSYWLGFSRKTTQCWQYRAGTNGSEKSTEQECVTKRDGTEEFSFCYKASLERFFLFKKKLQKHGFRYTDIKGILDLKFYSSTSI